MGLIVGLAAAASAQGWTEPDPSADPWNTASLKVGPVFLAPKFELQNLGVDNNVFRDETNPKQDLTATIAVSTIFGAHVKNYSVTFTQENKYIWFRRYTSERSIDGSLKAILEVRFNSLRPWISWSKTKTHDRFGYEVDTRAGRQTPQYELGADVALGDRTGFTVSFRNQQTLFDEQQFYDGVDLRDALDNRQSFAHVNGRWQYSELTDLTGGVEWTRTQFLRDPIKSGTTFSYFGGFKTHGDAPILGMLQVGYKAQRHDDPSVPDFRGLVFNGSLTGIVSDRVKLEVVGDRDLNYTYEPEFPYYVQEGAGVNLTARASTRLDLLGSGRGEWLHYSDSFRSGGLSVASRTDVATVVGIGFLYNAGGTTAGSHFGLTLERAGRVSPLSGKSFRNNRVLTNIRFNF